MTKEEYLKILQKELQSLPHDEQAEAMNYYRSYFEDAGDEKTASVIEELGQAEKLGAYIRSKFSCVPQNIPYKHRKTKSSASNKKSRRQHKQGESNILLLTLLLILTLPLWGSLVAGILGALFGIIVAFIASGFAGIVAAVAIFVAGIVVALTGISLFLSTPFIGLLGLGTGFFLLGLAVFFGIFFVWLTIKIIPFMIRGIVKICRLPFRNRTM